MDTTQTDVSDLLAQVHEAEAALWVRLALESRADGWFPSFAEVLVDVGLAEGRLWDAGDLVLVEEQVAPGVVEAVLLGSGFELDGRTILPVQRRPQAIREWVPSGRRYRGRQACLSGVPVCSRSGGHAGWGRSAERTVREPERAFVRYSCHGPVCVLSARL